MDKMKRGQARVGVKRLLGPKVLSVVVLYAVGSDDNWVRMH